MKTVVVTGASTGIGEACALRLDQRGFRVLACVRKTSDGEALKQKSSGRLSPLSLDITDREAIERAVETTRGLCDGEALHALVNNAGVCINGPLEVFPIEMLRQQIEVNVVGTLAVTQAFLPLLRRAHGRIVNVSSMCGRMSTPLAGSYSATKFALEAISDSLRVELALSGITVSVIEPGGIATPMWSKGRAEVEGILSGASPEQRALYAPMVRTLQKVARLVERTSPPPEVVAETVEQALTAGCPRTRYVVGRGAAPMLLLSMMPDRVRDWVLLRGLALASAS